MCFVYCGVVLLTDVWIVQSSDIRSYSTIVIFVNSDVVVVPGTHQTIIHRGTDTFKLKNDGNGEGNIRYRHIDKATVCGQGMYDGR